MDFLLSPRQAFFQALESNQGMNSLFNEEKG